MDGSEQRYLLTGLADGSLAVYDLAGGQRSAAGGADVPCASAGGGSAHDKSARPPAYHVGGAHPPPYAARFVHLPLLTIARTDPGAHRFGVSGVAWWYAPTLHAP